MANIDNRANMINLTVNVVQFSTGWHIKTRTLLQSGALTTNTPSDVPGITHVITNNT